MLEEQPLRQKKFLLMFWSTLIILYVLWVRTPGADYSQYLNGVCEEVESRFKERQRHAQDEQVNGFLNNTFQAYWGREGFEYQADSEVEKTVDSFSQRFSSVANGRVVDHLSLLDSVGERAIRKEFEALLPSLEVALSKPYFVVPQSGIVADSPTANYPGFRSLALALSGYCELLKAEGRVEESFEHLRLIFALGDKLVDLERNLPTMTGASIHSIGLQTLNGLVDPETDLSAAQWKRIADVLVEYRPQELTTGPYCVEHEYYIVLKSLETAECREQVPLVVRYLPGLLDREKRITRRVVTDILFRVGLKHCIYSLDFNWPGYLMGYVGFHSSSVTKDVFRMPKEIGVIDRRLVAYALCCRLLAYRKERGAFPESLEEIKTSTQDIPYPYSPDYKHEAGTAELSFFVRVPDSPLLDEGPFFNGGEGWAQAENGELLFRL